jgi:iron-sulfur cluster assembly protein
VITISETAAGKLREILAQEDGAAGHLRLFVTKGGCEGYTYGMGVDDEVHEGDQVLEQHGVRLVVDSLTLKVMAGARIDYRHTPMGEGFAVHNPRAVATCGCGHSFKTSGDAGEPEPCEQPEDTR